MEPNNDWSKKRRKRVPLSCRACRKKKIKCDRLRPRCSNCEKSSNRVCIYEPQELDRPEFGSFELTTTESQPLFELMDVTLPDMNKNSSSNINSTNINNKNNNILISTESSPRTINSIVSNTYKNNQVISNSNSMGNMGRGFSKFKVKLGDSTISKTSSVRSESSKEDEVLDHIIQPIQFTKDDNKSQSSNGNEEKQSNYFKHQFENTPIYFYKGVVPIKYEKIRLRTHNAGPLTGQSLLQKDLYGRLLFGSILKFIKLGAEKSQKMHFAWAQSESKRRVYGSFFKNGIGAPTKNRSADQLLLSPESDTIEELERIVSENLPPRSVIYLYIDRFFRYVYPFYPIIDELSFRADIDKVIGGNFSPSVSNLTEKVTVSLVEKSNLLETALLLYVLGFASLTVQYAQICCKDTDKESEVLGNDLEILKDYPIAPKILGLAKKCLKKLNYIHNTGLGLIQVLYLGRAYSNLGYDEEDGIPLIESGICASLLFSAATSVGLHRDPIGNMICVDSSQSESLKTLQLWRKLYHCLFDMDTEQSMNRNILPMLDTRHSDTKYPSYESLVSGSNCSDLNIEKSSIDHIIKKSEINLIIRKLLDQILDLRRAPLCGDLMSEVRTLENYVDKVCMTTEKFVEDFEARKKHSISKIDYYGTVEFIRKTNDYLSIVEFLFSIKYVISLETEGLFGPKYDVDLKCLLNMSVDLVSRLTLNSKFCTTYLTEFGSFRYLLTTSVLISMRKHGAFIISFVIRIVTMKYGIIIYQALPNSIYTRPCIFESLKIMFELYEYGMEFLTKLAKLADIHSTHSAHSMVGKKCKFSTRYPLCYLSDRDYSTEYSIGDLLKKSLIDSEKRDAIFPKNLSWLTPDYLMELLEVFQKHEKLIARIEDSISSPPFHDTSKQTLMDDYYQKYFDKPGLVEIEEIEQFWDFMRRNTKYPPGSSKFESNRFIDEINEPFKSKENVDNMVSSNNGYSLLPNSWATLSSALDPSSSTQSNASQSVGPSKNNATLNQDFDLGAFFTNTDIPWDIGGGFEEFIGADMNLYDFQNSDP